MKFKLTLPLLLVARTAFTQDIDTYREYDFSGVDIETIQTDVIGKQIDSIYRMSGMDSLSQLMQFVHSKTYSAKYMSFNVGYQSTSASMRNLNNGLEALGFNKLSDNFSGVPWGLEVKGKRLLFTYFIVAGIKNKAYNSDYSIEVKGNNVQLALGYDILNLKRLQLYPQVAFGLQDFDIVVQRKNAVNDIVTVNDLILNPAGTSLTKDSFDMSYGLELDYHLLHSNASGGIILGLRYGRVVTLADGKFKMDKSKTKFETSDSISDSFLSIVAKFYMKR